jgi:hypothetical protein
MANLVLQPAGGGEPQTHYAHTIAKPVSLSVLRGAVSETDFAVLQDLYPSGNARVWGAVPGPRNLVSWSLIKAGDVALFYANRSFFSSLRVTYRPEARYPEAARRLWGTSAEGETWECLFFLDDLRSEHLNYGDIWEMTRVGPRTMLRGLTVVQEPLSDEVIERLSLGRTTVDEEVSAAAVRAAERFRKRAGGQGFAVSPKVRLAIEAFAMAKAKAHFEAKGYTVADVSKRECYDLRCERLGQRLYVEVKGTQSSGEEVLLTPNEVAHARERKNSMVLFIVHSITTTGSEDDPQVNSDKVSILEPWEIDRGTLKPLAYSYQIPK